MLCPDQSARQSDQEQSASGPHCSLCRAIEWFCQFGCCHRRRGYTADCNGEVIEVSAIVGIGNRAGVDMVWGATAAYGHFGIDLVGQNGGVVRVDDIEINDVSHLFLGNIVATVDVRDYGAIGDGVTDDTAAFEAANSAANGRTVLIPSGTFLLNGSVTFDTQTKFEGKVTMPTAAILLLRRNFDLPNYIEAFEDEDLAFSKAFQALRGGPSNSTSLQPT
ncbi:glycosyl hydrolase family 28-related protein [Sulfitobacter sp.]|uniref:glycosyl hydrolase family 28-related protein n=1 Tax=Sulfitobacter sp. TaxID=1903071 RepID=UPI003002B7AD